MKPLDIEAVKNLHRTPAAIGTTLAASATKGLRARRLRFFFKLLLLIVMVPLYSAEAAQKSQPNTQKTKPQPVYCVAFSPDGKLLAAASGQPKQPGRVTVWDVATRKPRWVHREKSGVPSVAFAPDGKTLAIGGFANQAKLLDAKSGTVLKTFAGHKGWVRSVAFSPNGRRLITGSYDGTVKRWNVATGKAERTFKGHTQAIYSVAVSPDGDNIVSGSRDNTARVWEFDGGEVVRKFGPYSSIVRHVGWSADGRWLLTGSWDGIVRIRDTAGWNLRARIQRFSGVRRAELSADAKTLAVCDGGSNVRLFDVQLRDPDDNERRRIARLIADWKNDDIRVRNKASAELKRLGLICMPQIRAALKSSDAEVRIRARRLRDAVRSPEPSAVLKGHAADVDCLAFSSKGHLLASGDNAGRVLLWSTKTRREVATLVTDKSGR